MARCEKKSDNLDVLSTYTGVQRTYVISLRVLKILKLEVILSVRELLIVQESTEKAVLKNDYTL